MRIVKVSLCAFRYCSYPIYFIFDRTAPSSAEINDCTFTFDAWFVIGFLIACMIA